MTNAPGEWSDNGVMIEHSRCPRPVMETSVTEVMSELSDNTLRDLCLTNHEARGHTLLYVVMTNTNGHQVSGHVDLADRVAKLYWKEGIKDKSWILPKSGDLTFKRKDQVNYCSSVNWDVVIKDNVVKLLHIRTNNEILVGSTVKKKWNKVKNRIFKKEENLNDCSNGNGWKDLVSEGSLRISYYTIDIQN